VDGELKGHIEFVAQNVRTVDFGDPVFGAYALREVNGVAVAVIGQAFPYTPIANPRDLVPEWTFGIQEERLQRVIDEARGRGARVMVLLSHNGTDVDVKLAGRVRGLDVIFGGHTHDGLPRPLIVHNGTWRTLVTNAGSVGKFLAVLDLDVRAGGVARFRYRLLPVFADLVPADADMAALIARLRAPWAERLAEPLAVTEGLLYRRGNFSGTWDQLLVEALMTVKEAEIALSPGFRWGSTLLPGQTITLEDVMSQTALTYPETTLTDMTGEAIKRVLEDVCDNLFNPDPYSQQGGDMVRVGGLTYTCAPAGPAGRRISDLRLGGRPLAADRVYRVAGWAPVSADARARGGEAMWDVVARYLRDRKTVPPLAPNVPALRGVGGNAGVAP
jgi:S-sulfosulfanyl-L-cysteine sulfohydrolase